MTTTVTVKTHDWPVEVGMCNESDYQTKTERHWSHSSCMVFQPAHSEESYTVTDTQTVTVRELAKDATGLEPASNLSAASAS